MLGLQHPRGGRLVVQRPEDGDEEVEADQARERRHALLGEALADKPEAVRGDVGVMVTPGVEDERRDGHEEARHAKGRVRPR